MPPAAIAQQRVIQPQQFLLDERGVHGVVGIRVNQSDCLVSIRLERGTFINGLNSSMQTVLLRDGVVDRAKKLIREIDQICKLTDAQKKKLLNASRVDANRAARAFERWRQERDSAGEVNQREIRHAVGRVDKLRTALRSCIYEPTSLLSKMFASTATQVQQLALRDNYQEWFVKRVRDFDETREAKLLKMMQEKHQAGFLGAARETYIENVMSSIKPEELAATFEERDRDQIRRAIGMLVKP